MKITVVGTGYVGLVTGACLAEMGNHVLCLDLSEEKITALKNGHIPIYEPGLEEIVIRNAAAGRLEFTTDIAASVRHGTIQFIAVGTPPGEDGSADLSYVLSAARNIGRLMTDYKLVIDKSTVPVGTAALVKEALGDELKKRNLSSEFSVASNPEFLKEGAAVNDFMRPDRIVIGVEDDRSEFLLKALYHPFVSNRDRILFMDLKSAELSKYGANAMLATRISFMNELSRLAEATGADIESVRKAMGSDPRIGIQFLYAGCGYGGSCFPKDVKALAQMGAAHGVSLKLIESVEEINDEQKMILVNKIVKRFGNDLTGLKFGVWGLAFKPNTDDVREAPSFVVIKEIIKRGGTVVAYDPVAMHETKKFIGVDKGLTYVEDAYSAISGANALVLMTEWKEFRSPDFDKMKSVMVSPIMFDGRNIFEPKMMASFGFKYYPIGRENAAYAGE